jgi:hypothetical protein
MALTYDSIATTTLSSATQTITFSSIPSTYTDLRLVFNGPGSTANTGVLLRFNSVSTNTYDNNYMAGYGSGKDSYRTNQVSYIYCTSVDSMTASYPFTTTVDIFSYTSSISKGCLITTTNERNGVGSTTIATGLWRNNATISSISIFAEFNQFAIGSTASLYGILKA